MKIQNTEEIDWRIEVQISDDHKSYQAKLLNVLPELQHKWKGHLGLSRETEHGMEYTLADERPFHSAPYQADSADGNLKNTKST